MGPLGLPPSDEPADFRHQARLYARYRRDYSAALYEVIEERTGVPAGRRALDLACGTGLVTATLRRRGWRPVGVDLSAPMLREARGASGPPLALVRGRAEALPVAAGSVALVTCGTAFHWLGAAQTLAEVARVLAPGAWVALFWRYSAPGEPFMRLAIEVLGRFGPRLPADVPLHVHPAAPFAGSGLVAERPFVIETTLDFTVESFHGYLSSVEVFRRLAGAQHAAFLAAVREELARRFPAGFRERNQEHLYLARRVA
jgi:SAM-dependent methyltransferase